MLHRNEANPAVRLVRPDSDLTVTRLGQFAFHAYASPRQLTERDKSDW